MAYLLERDAINGKEGRAICTINGRQIEMFGMKKVQIDYDLQEADFKVVGTRLVQKKTTGITLTGSMSIYYGTPEFKDLVLSYMKSGELPYFTMQITNDDPSSTVGIQTIALYNVKLQKGVLALLDADSDFLTEDVSFSFTGFEIISAFNSPLNLG